MSLLFTLSESDVRSLIICVIRVKLNHEIVRGVLMVWREQASHSIDKVGIIFDFFVVVIVSNNIEIFFR